MEAFSDIISERISYSNQIQHITKIIETKNHIIKSRYTYYLSKIEDACRGGCLVLDKNTYYSFTNGMSFTKYPYNLPFQGITGDIEYDVQCFIAYYVLENDLLKNEVDELMRKYNYASKYDMLLSDKLLSLIYEKYGIHTANQLLGSIVYKRINDEQFGKKMNKLMSGLTQGNSKSKFGGNKSGVKESGCAIRKDNVKQLTAENIGGCVECDIKHDKTKDDHTECDTRKDSVKQTTKDCVREHIEMRDDNVNLVKDEHETIDTKHDEHQKEYKGEDVINDIDTQNAIKKNVIEELKRIGVITEQQTNLSVKNTSTWSKHTDMLFPDKDKSYIAVSNKTRPILYNTKSSKLERKHCPVVVYPSHYAERVKKDEIIRISTKNIPNTLLVIEFDDHEEELGGVDGHAGHFPPSICC